MPKNGIYRSNKNLISKTKSQEEQIFDCLYKQYTHTDKGLTKLEISQKVGIPINVVGKHLVTLVNQEPQEFGKGLYSVIFIDNTYRLVCDFKEQLCQDEISDDPYFCAVYDLADRKAFTSFSAKEITNTVISYEIKSNTRSLVIEKLKTVFSSNDYIYDIVPYKNSSCGVYIILKEPIIKKDFLKTKEQLLKFYKDVVIETEENKRMHISSAAKAKKM